MYPISVDVRGRRVVVVGGGDVAERKVFGLLEAEAAVTVVAPACTPELAAQAERGRVQWHARAFQAEDLDGAVLVFAATADAAVNARVSTLARERGIFVNDAGDAARGTFVTPAVHRTGGLTFSVETGGASPAFAARLRAELRARYDNRYARALATLATMRAYVSEVVEPEARARILRELAARPVDELAALNPQMAHDVVEECLAMPVSAARTAPYVCATRASHLALWQTRHVMAKLALGGTASTVLLVSTKGDEIQDRSLDALGSNGVFVKELESALRDRRADYAVHSCKDLPSTLPPDMQLAAIGVREDPRDAFCSENYASFERLPPGALVGTSSPRRRAQLQAMRPDLRYASIRGNVDTRLRKLGESEYDAIVLAVAGLKRLDLRAKYTVVLDVETMIPAAGQGALAIECRADDARLAALIRASIADTEAEIAVHAERAFLRALGAGCQAPVGAYATYDGQLLHLRGLIAARDGSRILRGNRRLAVRDAAGAEQAGADLARELEGQGGRELLAAGGEEPLLGTLFLLPRTKDRPSKIAPALRGAGAVVIEAATSEMASAQLAGRIPDVLLFPSSGSVAAISVYLATIHAQGAAPLVAAMGEASASAATTAGFTPNVVAPESSIAAFVQSATELVLGMNVIR